MRGEAAARGKPVRCSSSPFPSSPCPHRAAPNEQRAKNALLCPFVFFWFISLFFLCGRGRDPRALCPFFFLFFIHSHLQTGQEQPAVRRAHADEVTAVSVVMMTEC